MDKGKIFSVNKTLIWDYDVEGNYDTEEFKKWYVSRVLSCGVKDDLCKLGITTIKQYFLGLNLPDRIRQFWEWYFKYEHIH